MENNKFASAKKQVLPVKNSSIQENLPLCNDWDKVCHLLNKDANQVNIGGITISLVISVSQSNNELSWVNDFLNKHPFHHVSVISGELKPKEVNASSFIHVPNLECDDHQLVYFMSHIPENQSEHDVIFFVKDYLPNHNGMVKTKSIDNMVRVASLNGFACGTEPNYPESFLHNTEELRKFGFSEFMFGYQKSKLMYSSTFGNWLTDMKIDLPQPITPVCESSMFAVKTSLIPKLKVWETIRKHPTHKLCSFMKLLWAGVLTQPFTEAQVTQFQSYFQYTPVVEPMKYK